MRNPYRYFNSSPEVIRLTVMLYIRSPLSLRQIEDLLFEPGIDLRHETVRALVVPIRPDVRRGDPEQAIGGSVATCAARPAWGFSSQHSPLFVWFVSH